MRADRRSSGLQRIIISLEPRVDFPQTTSPRVFPCKVPSPRWFPRLSPRRPSEKSGCPIYDAPGNSGLLTPTCSTSGTAGYSSRVWPCCGSLSRRSSGGNSMPCGTPGWSVGRSTYPIQDAFSLPYRPLGAARREEPVRWSRGGPPIPL